MNAVRVGTVILALAGCHKPADETPPLTPEQAVATATEGAHVEVTGTVHALTFDSQQNGAADEDGGDSWTPVPGRWVLLRSETPDGIGREDLTNTTVALDANIARGWVLGVWVGEDQPRPRLGDTVTVTGTYRLVDWNGHSVPAVEAETLDAPAHGVLLGGICASDDECDEHLVCARGGTCAEPVETTWGSLWRDVDGHCHTDDDCPLLQRCDTSFVVPDDGPYTWRYDGSHKLGSSLCVPTSDALATACPVVWTTADLAGGRFTEGREICVEGVVQLTVGAEDGDTHLQLVVDEPIPYPSMDASIWLFGATTEIGPPYKNPDRPEGPVLDPVQGQHIVTLGTYRWDGGHGWYEQHPVKAWWPAD